MTNKPRILIVDDVASNIHLLMIILKEKYTIIAATNGEKALQLARTSPPPDLILLDVVMPDMDGYEVCRKLKDDEITAHIPVLFVTSLNSIAEQEEGLHAGAVDFITKPFSKEIVLHKVNTYLEFETLKNCDLKPPRQKANVKDIIMSNEKKTILAVDDSPENIQVMIEVLKEEYIVSVATSGKKALEMLSDGLKPDLILLDVVMPQMDGYELCERLKQKEAFASIPIIFVTILENEKDIVKGLELGAVDYVVKPIEPFVLKARVQTHLKLKILHDKLVEDIKTKDELIFSQSKLAVLGEMFENITHQWKQPLSTISVTTSGIKIEKEYGQLTDETLLHGLDNIDNSVKYLSQTIDDFKNFLVNDARQHTFNVREIIEKTLKLLASKFKSANISIENSVENIDVTTYQNDLIQVLMNIFTNAHDALCEVDENRKIDITSKIEDGKLIIGIADNAGGIDSQHIESIFNKYFTTKGEKEGTGVGLFMSQKIAQERLGGEIKVCNMNDGALFEIVLSK